MKRNFKTYIALFFAFIIIFSTINICYIKSYARSVDIDVDSEHVEIGIIPYDGIDVNNSILISSYFTDSDGNGFNVSCSLTDKSTMTKLKSSDVLIAGKKYIFSVVIKPTSDINMANYDNVTIVNDYDPNDNKFYKDEITNAKKDSLEYECVITVKEKPIYNKGTLTVDFTGDTGISESDSRTDYIFQYLKYLVEIKQINIKVDKKDNNIYGLHYDIDKDGNNDLQLDFKDRTIKRESTCNVKGEKSYSFPQDKCQEFEKTCENYYSKIIFKFSQNSSNTTNNNSAGKSPSKPSKTVSYKNEWVKGQWYDANGGTSYTAKGSWKSNSKGWWFEDSKGWYPHSQWQKIDGKWYYFTADGYMDYSEYRDGCWLGADGAWDENYSHGKWHLDGTGWWYEDNGWYPHNQYLWIDGVKYWFNSSGYMS